MAGLQFRFQEILRETKALQVIAKEFLDPSTTWVLDQFESNIKSLWSVGGASESSLELGTLRTRASDGDYEIGDRKGSESVVASITGKWDVRPIGDNSKKSKAKKKRFLEFCGAASTKIELCYAGDFANRIAMWRVELGAHDAPGCYFHIQVLGDEDEPPFPQAVPVPRFPSLFVTPMGAVEHVLGELFQDKWEKAAMGDSGDLPYWRELQRKRLEALLGWHQQVLTEAISSPWMALKGAKPDSELFLP